ncbi:sensor histidine kinase [Streptomyces sp. NPDC006879]|uniref:sensor histidine kinase n=1 Tax=Streptomyces sp. NPDC006879 TaxID=3364767 RepID=UPI00367C1A83
MSAVLLIAVVGAAIGTVTTLALRSHLVGQLDEQLVTAVELTRRGPARDPDPLHFVNGPGNPLGTVGVRLSSDGQAVAGARSVDRDRVALTTEQAAALADAVDSGGQRDAAAPRPVSVEVPGLGDFRVLEAPNGSLVVGFPLSGVQGTVGTLIVVEVCVTAAGVIAAGLAGQALVGVALRPLRRVAATATRVSELPLHRGVVALHERVPEAEADPRTEVGQVGAALNRMLGHVGSALSARQESETRVRQFVADASHELRTPLASIRGYAELTRRGREEIGPDTQHALGRIESEAARMTGLVEDLLLLARLDSGRPLSYQSTDLLPLVVDALSDARAAGPDHRWRLELPSEEAAEAVIWADAPRIQQILVNLLANARTHTPPGTTVTARVRATEPGGPQTTSNRPSTLLEIEDNGPGIPPGLLPHVFERFARGDASRSRHAGSTGLGLAIVQAVVTAHGGEVAVQSDPGRTVFRVRLPAHGPLVKPESKAPAVGAAIESAASADPRAPNSQVQHSFSTRV